MRPSGREHHDAAHARGRWPRQPRQEVADEIVHARGRLEGRGERRCGVHKYDLAANRQDRGGGRSLCTPRAAGLHLSPRRTRAIENDALYELREILEGAGLEP